MDEFIKELMQETVHFGMYDGEIPDYIISGLLQKHFGIRLDMSMYHFRPIEAAKEPSGKDNSLISQVYADSILQQLTDQTKLTTMFKKWE